MMRLACGASVAIVLLLLSSAGTALAESAWVLWQQETWSGEVKPWELIRAVPTFDACEAAQAEIIKNTAAFWGKAGRDAVSVVGNAIIIFLRDADGHPFVIMNTLRCLPDTIDPRGPKGK